MMNEFFEKRMANMAPNAGNVDASARPMKEKTPEVPKTTNKHPAVDVYDLDDDKEEDNHVPLHSLNDSEVPKWARNLSSQFNAQISKVKTLVEDKNMNAGYEIEDIDLEEKELLPEGFKMPKMDKYKGVSDPKIHLNTYAFHMRNTKLTQRQKVDMFILTLEGLALLWYHKLDKVIRSDWKLLRDSFLKQYEYNAKFEVSLSDLELIKQKLN